MPPTNDPPHRHTPATPRARRNSKPKFEIPVETGLYEAPVGWVYRADEAPAPPVPNETRREQDAKAHPLLMAGMGMIFIGVGTIGFVSLAALGLIAVPIRWTRGIFGSD